MIRGILSCFIVWVNILLLVLADKTTTSKTLVWHTGTNLAGVLTTTQSPYTQTFTSLYSETAQPSSGNIGLGSLSGKVGQIRTYERVTVSQDETNDARSFVASHNYLIQFPIVSKVLITTMLLSLVITLLI